MFTSLDRNVTFEIGRNEFKSSGSVMVSLSRKWPELASVKREETRTAEMRCRRPQWPALARQLVARFTSHVGAGSRSQCLHGALHNNRTTSATVTLWNDSSFADSRWVMCAKPAVAVLARILVTLSVKCVAMSSALCRNLDAVGGLDTLLIVDHSWRGLLQCSTSALDQ